MSTWTEDTGQGTTVNIVTTIVKRVRDFPDKFHFLGNPSKSKTQNNRKIINERDEVQKNNMEWIVQNIGSSKELNEECSEGIQYFYKQIQKKYERKRRNAKVMFVIAGITNAT